MRPYISILLSILLSSYMFSQKSDTTNQHTATTIHRPSYLGLTFGIQPTTFRDMATSPLFYKGKLYHIALSHTDFDKKRTSSIRLSYTFGNCKNNFAKSHVRIFAFNYLELFELIKLHDNRFHLKFGGQLNAALNLRNNPSLGNNRDGFELITTMFGSTSFTIDLNKKEAKKHRHQLNIAAHIGLMNSTYRNGFIYTRHSPMLNRDHINEGYRFSIFAGYRFQTALEYTAWFNNNNAIQLTYLWDIYNTGGQANRLEMATHLFHLSILFRLN